MANIAVRFKLVGPNKGKTIVLGPKKQYPFVDGICEFECKIEDAAKHAHQLVKFYSAKRVKPSKDAAEAVEVLPDEDEVDEEESKKDESDDKSDDESPPKKASKKTK